MKQDMEALLHRFHDFWQSGKESDFTFDELKKLESHFSGHSDIDKLNRVIQLGIKQFPGDPYFMVRYAHLLLDAGRSKEAREVWSYLNLEYPMHIDTHLLDLHLLLHNDPPDFQGFARRLQKIIDTFSPLETPLASLLFQLTKWIYHDQFPTEKWMKKILAATEQTPEDIREYLLGLDDISLLPEHADSLFMEVIGAFPEDVSLMLMYASYLLKRKRDRAQAKEWLLLVLLQDPENVTAHLYLAEIMESEADYDKAIIHYNQILSLNDPSASIYMRIGVCHEKSGRPADARSYYRMAVDEDPAFLPAWHALIQSYSRNDQLDKAISVNMDAVDKIPNRKLFETLGYLFLQKKYYPSALKAYEEAYRMGSHDKNILLILHDLYDRNGDFHKAEQMIRHARWQYPDDKDVLQRIKKYDLW